MSDTVQEQTKKSNSKDKTKKVTKAEKEQGRKYPEVTEDMLKEDEYESKVTTTSLIIPTKTWDDFSIIIKKKFRTLSAAEKSKSAVITRILKSFNEHNKQYL